MMFSCQHSFASHCTLTQCDCMSISSKLSDSSRRGLSPCSPPKLCVSEERDWMKSSRGDFLTGDCGAQPLACFPGNTSKRSIPGEPFGQMMTDGSGESNFLLKQHLVLEVSRKLHHT
ncbi:hypothetical protein Nmel_002339 [Mimus melanotis]